MAIIKTLEEYILQAYLGEQTMKGVSDLQNLDPERSLGTMLSYKIKGKIYRLRRPMWGPLRSMYLANVYADLICKGYLCTPVEGGWIVYGGDTPYQIPATVDSCGCKDYIYEQQKGHPEHKCQHLLMVLAVLDMRARVAALVSS